MLDIYRNANVPHLTCLFNKLLAYGICMHFCCTALRRIDESIITHKLILNMGLWRRIHYWWAAVYFTSLLPLWPIMGSEYSSYLWATCRGHASSTGRREVNGPLVLMRMPCAHTGRPLVRLLGYARASDAVLDWSLKHMCASLSQI